VYTKEVIMTKKNIDRQKVLRNKSMRIRVTLEEHEKIKRLAEKENKTISDLLRDRVLFGEIKR